MIEKKVIVTGGGRGIGKAIAERLLTDGYEVTILSHNEQRLQQAVAALSEKGKIAYAVVDLRDRDAVRRFAEQWQGTLYGLVNNAGIVGVERIDEDKHTTLWDDVLDTNLHGPYWLTKGVVNSIVDGGRIVNISSQLGKAGRAGYSAYCASKFALIGLSKTWAFELGERNITVNAVCPGWVATDMGLADNERIAKERGISREALMREISGQLEIERFTEPSEVADLVGYLFSDQSSMVTGQDVLMQSIWNQP